MKNNFLSEYQIETECVRPENAPNSMDCNVASAQTENKTDGASVSGLNENNNVGGIASNHGQLPPIIDFSKLFVFTFRTNNYVRKLLPTNAHFFYL